MRKIFLVLCVSALLLSACTQQTDGDQPQSSQAADESDILISAAESGVSTASEHSGEAVTNVYVIRGDGDGRYLPNVYEFPIKAAFASGEWINDTAECLCDFKIIFIDATFEYHSECGTVVSGGKSMRLSANDKENVNELLFSLYAEE